MTDPDAQWQPLAAVTSMVEVITTPHGLDPDDDVRDISALIGSAVPTWIQQLTLPAGWQPLVVPPGDRPAAIARGAVAGRHDRRWEATHTLSVFSYTGHAWFKDVVGNAACTLAGLDAINVRSRVLAVPPIPYVVAVRADGVLTFGERPLWLQQSNYLAGSDQPHTGQLIIHNVFVDADVRHRWARDVETIDDAVHRGFTAHLDPPRSGPRDG